MSYECGLRKPIAVTAICVQERANALAQTSQHKRKGYTSRGTGSRTFVTEPCFSETPSDPDGESYEIIECMECR